MSVRRPGRIELGVGGDPPGVNAPVVKVILLRKAGLLRRGVQITAAVRVDPSPRVVVYDDFLAVVAAKIGMHGEVLDRDGRSIRDGVFSRIGKGGDGLAETVVQKCASMAATIRENEIGAGAVPVVEILRHREPSGVVRIVLVPQDIAMLVDEPVVALESQGGGA